MSLPEFSVIVPTYRRPEALAACLRSLAQQTFPPEKFEVIVVDDAGSAVDVAHVAATRYPFECRILSQTHGGAAAARNAGAHAARGRFLAFTDDDCRPAPDWLWSLERRMNLEGDKAFIGGRVVNELTADPYACASQSLVDFLYERLNQDPQQAQLLTSNNFCATAASFRAFGGFDTTFRGAGGEDREICLRWAKTGGRLSYASEVLVYHAHALTLVGFLRQHYAYGRGAAWLRYRARVHGYGPLPLEHASFYLDLLRYPERAPNNRHVFQQTALFALSQMANTAGYLWVRALKR